MAQLQCFIYALCVSCPMGRWAMSPTLGEGGCSTLSIPVSTPTTTVHYLHLYVPVVRLAIKSEAAVKFTAAEGCMSIADDKMWSKLKSCHLLVSRERGL